MATKFTPLHDRILVRRVEEAATTRGGILIPDSAKDKPQEGEVISVGKGKSNEDGKVFPLAVKEGDHILFGKYAGTEIKIDGEEGRGSSWRTCWRHQEGNRGSAAVVVRSWSPVASSRTSCNPRHSAGLACKKSVTSDRRF